MIFEYKFYEDTVCLHDMDVLKSVLCIYFRIDPIKAVYADMVVYLKTDFKCLYRWVSVYIFEYKFYKDIID
jgi:hypothetical protein